MSMWRPLASPCTFLSGWWMEGACRLPSWLARSHRNHPKKSEVCANSPCRAQTHAHTQTRGRVPGLAGERLGAAGASAAAGCRLARQKGQTRGKGRRRPSRPSPRPGRGGGGTSTGSLNCSPCQQEDFSPVQKSQKKNVSQGPENSSYKGPGSKYFRLCRPHGLECVLEPKEQPWRTHTRLGVAASGKILLTKQGYFAEP